jgi:glycosyltransferase involved in cell wall biosynthesis
VEAFAIGSWIRQQLHLFCPDVLWIVLDSDVVLLADQILRHVRVPVHLSIHDDPEIVWRMELSAAKPLDGERILERCLQRAQSVDVISMRMKERFQKITEAELLVLTRGFDNPCEQAPPPTAGPTSILMGGWFGPDIENAWILFEAFELLRAEQDAELHLVDRRLEAFRREGVTIYDWMDTAEFDRLLHQAALGFAHDPLRGVGREFAASSFPTKVVTYVGAGRPFVYHGPSNSTVGDFVQKYRCGIVVDSEDPRDLAEAFRRLARSCQDDYRRECRRAAEDLFDLRTLRANLYRTLSATALTSRPCEERLPRGL